MDKLVKKLAQARKLEALCRSELAAVENSITEKFGTALSFAKDNITVAVLICQDAEESLRQASLEEYERSGVKQVHPAITVKVFKRLEYNVAEALDYCRKHLPQALKLDTKAFEKAAGVVPLDFVISTEEPKATIAKDLSQWE